MGFSSYSFVKSLSTVIQLEKVKNKQKLKGIKYNFMPVILQIRIKRVFFAFFLRTDHILIRWLIRITGAHARLKKDFGVDVAKRRAEIQLPDSFMLNVQNHV